MASIYLSYKLEDLDLAKNLAFELEKLGHRAVYDAVALSPGMDWRLVLMEALSRSDAVLVLLTDRALTSPFVLGEIGAARALNHAFGQMLLLPVIVGNLPIPPVVSDVFVLHLPAPEAVTHTAAEVDRALNEHFARLRRGHPRIFISHRHRDTAVAQALVRVIEAAFEVDSRDIRCTSVHPYKLPVGERNSDRLKAELRCAEVVLGILTPDVKESSYVLFELGSAWGRKGGVTFPLLASGASMADVPAPIGDLHTLSLHDEAECHQLVDDLADVVTLRRHTNRAGLLAERIRELVVAAATVAK